MAHEEMSARLTSLSQAIDLVSWEQDSPLIDSLRQGFEDHIGALVRSAKFEADTGGRLLAGIGALPDAAQRRLFSSPQFVAQIIGWRRDQAGLNLANLSEMVLAELAREGILPSLPIDVWSSRGDIFFSAGEKRPISTPWLIEGEVAIDDRSPQLFPYDGDELKLLLPLEGRDRDLVSKRLNASWSALTTGSPAAAHVVRSSLEQIAIRQEPGAPTRFNSSSFSLFIGLALLNNPHVDKVDPANLAEALVHEAIHSVLFLIEELEAPLLADRTSALTRVDSPWSGATINLHAYLHACVVWYGLFCLWTHLMQTSAFPQARCLVLRERARSGFAHRPVTRIRKHWRLLSPHARDIFEDLESRMLAAPAT